MPFIENRTNVDAVGHQCRETLASSTSVGMANKLLLTESAGCQRKGRADGAKALGEAVELWVVWSSRRIGGGQAQWWEPLLWRARAVSLGQVRAPQAKGNIATATRLLA